MARILVIEDDQRIRELVCKHLADQGHAVSSEATGLDGLQAVTAEAPELLVLDLGLPDLDGLDLIKMIRSIAEIPVLVLTAREDEQTVLSAFDGGADDYVVGPVSGPQLSARVAALLRRSSKQKAEVLKIDQLEIHLGPRQVFFENHEIELTAKEFDVLAYLAERSGTVVSKEELHAAVWKSPTGTEGRTIDVHIKKLREKISSDKIKTVKGFGYKFDF